MIPKWSYYLLYLMVIVRLQKQGTMESRYNPKALATVPEQNKGTTRDLGLYLNFIDSCVLKSNLLDYHIAGKFGGGKFGKSSVIHQTEIIQISTYN